jgi:predicted nucleic acid-binding protein
MSGKGKVFLDTNLFIYSYDDRDPIKRSMARELIRTVTFDRTGVVSYQVVQEFFHVLLVKAVGKLNTEDAQQVLATVFRPLLAVHSSVALFGDAIHLQKRHRLSWYDSLIVAAAQQSGCAILYTEDLQHGQRFGDLAVVNPFR